MTIHNDVEIDYQQSLLIEGQAQFAIKIKINASSLEGILRDFKKEATMPVVIMLIGAVVYNKII